MVIGKDFVWLHLPKTGGTSTSDLFSRLALPGISIDDDSKSEKHDSRALRMERYGIDLYELKPYISFRKLSSWLLSDFFHKRNYMGLDLSFDPVANGFYYSMRLGGKWTKADWWLEYFEVDESFTLLRLEHLKSDMLRLFPEYVSAAIEATDLNVLNDNEYGRSPDTYFDRNALNQMYLNNPIWAALEEKHYAGPAEANDTYL